MISPSKLRVISVFGSHAPQPGSPGYVTARELGRLLAEAGFAVATGGYEGTMAATSQGAAESGGQTIGVTSVAVEKSRGARKNSWIKEEIRYDSLHERQLHLVTQNHGIVVLEGGIGTLAEFSLAWSLRQVQQLEHHPLVLLGRLWQEVLPSFIRPEYISQENAGLCTLLDTPAEAVEHIVAYWARRT